MSEAKVEKAVEPKTSLTIEELQKVFEDRQKVLLDFFDKEANVANRYDIKLRIEELGTIFSAIMNALRN